MQPNNSSTLSRIALGALGVIVIIGTVFLLFHIAKTTEAPTQGYIDRKLAKENETYRNLQFHLVDPDEAPQAIRTMAKLGFQIMIHTQKYAGEYANDKLNCTNCHFAGGDTTGGAGGGISLAGVAAKYPAYDSRFKRVIDLPARINNCFERSMNGKPLPLDSELMLAIMTYLQWISKDIPIYSKVPWLGLTPLTTSHQGDTVQGKRVYTVFCSMCHRDDGQGGVNTPPLWGPNSFNNEAGMSQLPTLAAFVYWNMPYLAPTPALTQEEAVDVASYVLSQPRSQSNE